MNFVIVLVNRMAFKRKIKYGIENVTESNDECDTELDLNILSSKKTKQFKQVCKEKNNISNNVQKKKSKFK